MNSSLAPLKPLLACCGRCGGRLRVETAGPVVACPHCRATLEVFEEAADLPGLPTLPAVEDPSAGSSIFGGEDLPPPTAVAVSSDVELESADDLAVEGSTAVAAALADDEADAADSLAFGQVDPAPFESRPFSARPVAQGVPRRLFLFVLIYASLASAAALGLAYVVSRHHSSELESLPDVVPKLDRDGQVRREQWPETAPMPPGHTLALGETGRFGDLRVTPLDVSRAAESASQAVYTLAVKFENLGDHAAFAPLDADLLFFRMNPSATAPRGRANNFLAPAADRAYDSLRFVDGTVESGRRQGSGGVVGTRLNPGETQVARISTAPDGPPLSGPLAWRLHLRKGVSPGGYGVTTLVEVVFDEAAARRG